MSATSEAEQRKHLALDTLYATGDIVSDALYDLGRFGPDIDRPTASSLLDLWVRKDELTDSQRAEVLAYYREMEP